MPDLMRPLNAGFRLATRLILFAILFGMLAYLGLFVYFMAGRSWGLPVILTPGHEKVLVAQRDYIERNLRLAEIKDKLGGAKRQLAEMEAARDAAGIVERSVDTSVDHEAKSLDKERKTLDSARGILSRELDTAKGLLGDLRREARPAAELKAGLIDRTRYLAELLLQVNLSLNVSNLTVSLSQMEVQSLQLDKREHNLVELRKAKEAPEGAPGFEEASKIDLLYKARVTRRLYEDEVQRLKSSADTLRSIEAELVSATATLRSSPLIAASTKPTAVIFVPYENIASYDRSGRIMRCAAWLFLCSEAGKISRMVDGEIILPHPLFGKQVRGALYALEVPDVTIARDALLFSSSPLFF